MGESYKPNDPYRPFSNGTEHHMWLEANCMRGCKGCRRYKPEASSSRHGCPIEVALAIGNASDGRIKASMGLRGGFLEPGPKGTLIEPDKPTWECPEYEDRDGPDNRPRRGPRPSPEQQDLLDPRNAPMPSRHASKAAVR